MRMGVVRLSDKIYDTIRRLEESHLDLEIRASVGLLGNILADDFIEIGSSGRMYGKKECLELGVSMDKMIMHDFKIQL